MCIVLINTAHLLATVAWQIEDQHREKRDAHTRYYKVDSVKQSLPSHGDVERDVEVGLVAARVKFFISANETLDVTGCVSKDTSGYLAANCYLEIVLSTCTPFCSATNGWIRP